MDITLFQHPTGEKSVSHLLCTLCTQTPERASKTCAWISEGPHRVLHPEGHARHLDVSRQKLSPSCVETIFDSQSPSPKLSPKMPPKLSLANERGQFFLLQKYPRGEGNCETIEREKLSRGNFCPATSRCLFWPSASRGGTEGGAVLLHYCGAPDPFSIQQNEPFLP